MKKRCQCGKPSYIVTERGFWSTWWTNVQPTDLHFRKADRYCERCGTPLCEMCSKQVPDNVTIEDVFLFELNGEIMPRKFYCHTCKELGL